jgi:hypothetical protein
MDSGFCEMPSPILPDGTLLSLPIPDDGATGPKYAQLAHQGKSYLTIMQDLTGKTPMLGNCHLDPDLRQDIIERPDSWMAAYGQCEQSAKHLDNQDVSIGDLFLFFGWFRQTEYSGNGKLRYVKNAPDQHIVFGYLKIGDILYGGDLDRICPWHPHALQNWQNNRLYLAADRLTHDWDLPGYGVLPYHQKRVLTSFGQQKRSVWILPYFFQENDVKMTYHPKTRFGRNGSSVTMQSVGRGQEFVISSENPDAEKILESWALDMILSEPDCTGRKSRMVDHLAMPDHYGNIYCRADHAIRPFDRDSCFNCGLLSGCGQGMGPECTYEDIDNHEDWKALDWLTPYGAYTRANRLIEEGRVPRKAVRG